jgi:hypothetical protein
MDLTLLRIAVINGAMKNESVRSVLLEVGPECGKLAETAVALGAAELADLGQWQRS